MPKIELQGTNFTCRILPAKGAKESAYVHLSIAIENEYVRYADVRRILPEDMEEWLCSIYRLLAGAYSRPYTISFDGVGLSVDLYPNSSGEAAGETSHRKRREQDCAMAMRLLMRSADTHMYLGGVYTLLFQKQVLQTFANTLKEEFYALHPVYTAGRGEYAFVGVSPLGYQGCNYWYYDETGEVKSGDYVWVKMGKNATEQIVFVDCARRFLAETAPYDPKRVKKVLRKATAEEVAVAKLPQK